MGKITKSLAGSYSHGDRVFAKMKGYPYWPARIEMIPSQLESKDKYQVMFYGTYQTLVIKAEFLLPYNEETKQSHGKERKQKSFNVALDEIENDPNLENVDNNKSDKEGDQDKEDDESGEEDEEQEDEEDADEELYENETESTETKSSKSNESSVKSNRNKKSQQARTEAEPSRRSSRNFKSKDQDDKKSVKQDEIFEETIKTEASEIKKKRRNSEQPLSSVRKEPSRISGRARLASNQSETSIKSDEPFANTVSPASNQLLDESSKASSDSTSQQIARRLSSRPKQPNKRYSQTDQNEEESKKIVKGRKNSSLNNIDTDETVKSKRKRTGSNTSTSNSTKSDSIKTIENLDDPEGTLLDNKNETKPIINLEMIKKNNDLYQDENSSSLDRVEKPSTQTKSNDKEWLKMKLKEKKINQKKQAFILGIRLEIALDRMDKEIKKSLRVDKTDVNRCCLIMQDLIKLPFAKKHLFKSSNIVETVRKCRKFKDSELVRQRSNEFFSKLYELFTVTSEQFISLFERERAKFLNENEKEIKKEKIWKEKCLNEDKHISVKKNRIKHTKSLIEDLQDQQQQQSSNNCFDSEAQE